MSAPAQLREKHEGAYVERASLRLWLRLLSCTMVIEKRLQRRLATRFGSTLPRFDVLAALDRHPEGLTMGALSQALLVSNGNVTGLVRGLVAEGYVETGPSPDDRRVSIAHLSEAGRAHFAEAAAAHQHWIEAMFSRLDPGERDSLHALLGTLKQSLSTAASHEDAR
jgi:DNA-binding MarR family transcriptional regulator